MRVYLLSLGAGVLVGIVYGFLNVRSPAPPVVALIGLLGILVGEQVIPVGKKLIAGSSIGAACRQSQCVPHLFGMLPGRDSDRATAPLKPAQG